MKCPYCGNIESKVADSRPTDDFEKIRRRRECLKCGKRFTTYEIIETAPLYVIKRDGSREAFNNDKLLNGLTRACEKRPVSIKALEDVVREVEASILNSLEKEIYSTKIGELALEKLKCIDQVAYVRFASVYRKFDDVKSFVEELKNLK